MLPFMLTESSMSVIWTLVLSKAMPMSSNEHEWLVEKGKVLVISANAVHFRNHRV
jgi:hypothetical protein